MTTAWFRALRCGVAVAIAFAAAGCGGDHHPRSASRQQPKLPHALATQLAAVSVDVARRLDAGDACGALATARSLQQRTIDAINSGSVPGPLQEPLQSAVTDLAARIRCTPRPASSPPAAPAPAKKHGHEHKDNGKHKGHDGDEGD